MVTLRLLLQMALLFFCGAVHAGQITKAQIDEICQRSGWQFTGTVLGKDGAFSAIQFNTRPGVSTRPERFLLVIPDPAAFYQEIKQKGRPYALIRSGESVKDYYFKDYELKQAYEVKRRTGWSLSLADLDPVISVTYSGPGFSLSSDLPSEVLEFAIKHLSLPEAPNKDTPPVSGYFEGYPLDYDIVQAVKLADQLQAKLTIRKSLNGYDQAVYEFAYEQPETGYRVELETRRWDPFPALAEELKTGGPIALSKKLFDPKKFEAVKTIEKITHAKLSGAEVVGGDVNFTFMFGLEASAPIVDPVKALEKIEQVPDVCRLYSGSFTEFSKIPEKDRCNFMLACGPGLAEILHLKSLPLTDFTP